MGVRARCVRGSVAVRRFDPPMRLEGAAGDGHSDPLEPERGGRDGSRQERASVRACRSS